jgi:UDP-N-acetylglucosamine--N-acetylmuramyl-(pentapeptide) pyrophosphoryl-undecaprenol N-acetylglucosamine transferase
MSNQQKFENLQRLVISCGGTGGHFYPGLSIAREFAAQGGEVLFCLSGKERLRQSEIVVDYGFECFTFNAPRLPRTPLQAIKFFPQVIVATAKVKKKIAIYQPDAILAMGSFTSLPAALTAKWTGIPLFLHDGNARIGRANRFISRWCKFLGTAFPAVNQQACKCPVHCLGMPLRPELKDADLSKATAITQINEKYESTLNPESATILIVGGSLGAETLNDVFPRTCLDLPPNSLQVIHLTGKDALDQVSNIYKETEVTALSLASSPDMALFYEAADAVICRAGGSTIAELALFGKYAILIPFPFAAEKHQDDNAGLLTQTGGAEMCDNADCNHEWALELLQNISSDPAAYRAKGKKSQSVAKPDAAMDLLAMVDQKLSRSR